MRAQAGPTTPRCEQEHGRPARHDNKPDNDRSARHRRCSARRRRQIEDQTAPASPHLRLYQQQQWERGGRPCGRPRASRRHRDVGGLTLGQRRPRRPRNGPTNSPRNQANGTGRRGGYATRGGGVTNEAIVRSAREREVDGLSAAAAVLVAAAAALAELPS